MRLGIGSYTYPWAVGVPGHPRPSSALDAEGLVAQAVRAGVSLVQICDNIPLHEMGGRDLERVRARARGSGVALEIGTRGTAPSHLRAYLELAAALDARLVRSMITDSIESAEEDLRSVIPDFERSGVVLALENYEKHSVRALAGLIERVGSRSLGACLDTVNSLGALETPREAIAALLPHTVCLHVKDFTVERAEHRMGFSVLGAPAGRGSLDVPALIAAARAQARDPNAVLELWTPFAGTVEETIRRERQWAEQSISALRRYIES